MFGHAVLKTVKGKYISTMGLKGVFLIHKKVDISIRAGLPIYLIRF
jgi:hypothetical protein